jgi:glycerol-3-phosphate O-acyltransferase
MSAWVRPKVIGDDPQQIGLNPSQPVCYVLPNLSLADLLVTDHACRDAQMPSPVDPISEPYIAEDRAYFYLAHSEGRFLQRPSMRAYSSRLLRIVTTLRTNTASDIQLVPVSLFWGHAPDREKSIFKTIFSDNWVATGRIKKTFALIFHSRHIVLRFSPPISLRELIDNEPDPHLQLRKLRRLLRVHFRRQRQAILGPDLSHRRTLVDTLLSGTLVQDMISLESNEQNIPRSKIEDKARQYANEIAAHQSYNVLRTLYSLLTWLWNRLYEGIAVNNIERVQSLAEENEIVYVPCHRSHIDYLLLSYVLYANGLTPPHIAAGKNLNMPLVGPVLRRCGAFFMRRSFSGDPLYKTVFDEYMHLMFIKGYAVEYFVEGGRSRTGRMLQPRTGMVSMTMHGYQRDPSLPLVFMPVYFGYEKILEAGTYVDELKGKPKQRESVFDLFSIFKRLKSSFGRVSVNFGEPLYLSDFMDTHLPEWRTMKEVGREDSFTLGTRLANELGTRINKAAAINPINLVATILLATPKQVIDETRLREGIDFHLRLFQAFPYTADSTITSLSATEIIDKAVQVSILTRKNYRFGNILSAEGDVAVLLTYYKNNISHILALPSLVARLLLTANQPSNDSLLARCMQIYPYLRAELLLYWQPSDLDQILTELLQAMDTIGLVETNQSEIILPATASSEFAALDVLSRMIEPTLERYLIALSVLEAAEEVSRNDWESSCQIIAEQLSVIYGHNAPEFFDRSLFSTFISTMIVENVVTKKLERQPDLDALKNMIGDCLSPNIQHNINQAVSQLSNPTV